MQRYSTLLSSTVNSKHEKQTKSPGKLFFFFIFLASEDGEHATGNALVKTYRKHRGYTLFPQSQLISYEWQRKQKQKCKTISKHDTKCFMNVLNLCL